MSQSFPLMSVQKRILEKTIATVSFGVAVALAFTSMFLSEDNDIAANVCLAIAQFLTLTATLLGIDYKFTSNDFSVTSRNQKQQSAKSPKEQ